MAEGDQDGAVALAANAGDTRTLADEVAMAIVVVQGMECHKAGLSDVEIAKELGLGLGEVKLVLGLYQPGEA